MTNAEAVEGQICGIYVQSNMGQEVWGFDVADYYLASWQQINENSLRVDFGEWTEASTPASHPANKGAEESAHVISFPRQSLEALGEIIENPIGQWHAEHLTAVNADVRFVNTRRRISPSQGKRATGFEVR